MSKYLRAGSLCLLISSLSYQACGCTLDGIDIQKMFSQIVQHSSGVAKAKSSVQQESKEKGGIDLAKVLGDSACPETVIAQVKVRLKGAKAGYFTDTDEEKEKTEGKNKRIEEKTKKKKVPRLAAMANKNRGECLLAQGDWKHNKESPEENTKQLCEYLALDAYEIANISGEGKDKTCLCVLLGDKKNRVHKIVFHNSSGQLAPTMRSKAGDLNYTARNLRKGHAEAQFVSFLLIRMKQKSPPLQYCHIIGMGCSRRNCPNCAVLLKFFLGKKYVNFHAYASEEKFTKEKIRMKRKEIDGKTKIVKTIPEQIDHIEAVYPGSEVGSYPKNDYLLPENILEVLEARTGRNLDVQ